MYRFIFYFLLISIFSCSDDQITNIDECQDCEIRTISDEIVACEISTEEEILNIEPIGEFCDLDEIEELKLTHSNNEKILAAQYCHDRFYTLKTRVVCE